MQKSLKSIMSHIIQIHIQLMEHGVRRLYMCRYAAYDYTRNSENGKVITLIATPLWRCTFHFQVFSWPTRLLVVQKEIMKELSQNQKTVSFFFRWVSQKLFEDQCKMPLYCAKVVMTFTQHSKSPEVFQTIHSRTMGSFITPFSSVCKPLSNEV